MTESIRHKPLQVEKTDMEKTTSSANSQPFELKEEGYHIDDFLRYDGREFVMNAYRGILGRECDPEGFNNYLTNLIQGEMTRTQILESLRYSPEGRAKGVPVRGLLLPDFDHSFYRIPVLGFFIQLMTSIIRLPKIIKIFRSKIESLANEKAEVTYAINRQEFDTLATQKADVSAVEEKLAAKVDRSEFEIVVEQNEESKNRIRNILRRVHDNKLDIQNQNRRLQLLLEEAKKRLPEPFCVKQIEDIIKEEDHLLDAMYVAFEDRFRGTRQDIIEKQKVYLPYIQKVKSNTEDFLVLDAGCGRGEWLELLKRYCIRGLGVDTNRVMVKQCEEYSLNVIEGDVIESLQDFPSNYFGAVTAFHLIEHFPFDVLVKFLDETVRVLKPGGIAIFETPNPENIFVGACAFYLDPTHRQPLPGQMMKFLAEARGLYEVEIMYLNPYDEEFKLKEDESELAKRFESYFYGPRDYAIIGYK
jgi:O-antigen chain-terminating methyltransferase